MKKLINRYNILILLFFLLCVIDILLVNLFTIKINPNKGISGNGNPGLMFVIAFIPILFGLVTVIIIKCVKMKNERYPLVLLLFGTIGTIFFSIRLWIYIDNQYQSFGNRLDGFKIINQYTNTIFINFYSFFLSLSLLFFILGIIIALRKKC